MAKTVIINGVTYPNVPSVRIPLAEGSGSAVFVDTDSGDAVGGDLRAGKKAWVAGSEITGTAASKSSADLTVSGKTVSAPAGIYAEAASASIPDAGMTVTPTVSGDVLGTAVSDYPVLIGATATALPAGYASGTYSAAGGGLRRYVQVEEKTAAPSVSVQDILPGSGKLLKKVRVSAVDVSATASEADVLSGKTFFSGSLTRRTGTATVPTVGQDSTTKVLTVS